MSPAPQKIIRAYVWYVFFSSVAFVVVHQMFSDREINFFKVYLPLTFLLSLVMYRIQFRSLIALANFQGDGRYYAFVPYFIGMTFTPLAFMYAFVQPELVPAFFYKVAFALGVSGITSFALWVVVKWGDEDWTSEDDDKPSLQ